MPPAKQVVTVSRERIGTVLVRDDITVLRARGVVDMLQQPGASFRSVADAIGIAPSALHRFIGMSGYKLGARSTTYERTNDE